MMTVSNSKEPVRVLYNTVDGEEFGAYPWDVGSTLFSAQVADDEFYFMRVMFTTNVTADQTSYSKALKIPPSYVQYEASALIHVASGNLAMGRNIARANGDAEAIAKAVRIEDKIGAAFNHVRISYVQEESPSIPAVRGNIHEAFGSMFVEAYSLGEHQVNNALAQLLPPSPQENDNETEAQSS